MVLPSDLKTLQISVQNFTDTQYTLKSAIPILVMFLLAELYCHTMTPPVLYLLNTYTVIYVMYFIYFTKVLFFGIVY